MKRYLNIVTIIASVVVMMAGCMNPYHPCLLEHYKNQTPRAARSFENDTLNMAQLAGEYMSLVDGDTIVVRGYKMSAHALDGYRERILDYTMYLHDNDTSFEGLAGHIQFLEERRLWLLPISGMDSLSDDTPLVLRGILHFDFWGPGVAGEIGQHHCAEVSYLNVLEFTKESEE